MEHFNKPADLIIVFKWLDLSLGSLQLYRLQSLRAQALAHGCIGKGLLLRLMCLDTVDLLSKFRELGELSLECQHLVTLCESRSIQVTRDLFESR